MECLETIEDLEAHPKVELSLEEYKAAVSLRDMAEQYIQAWDYSLTLINDTE